MGIVLEEYNFDEARVSVSEKHEEVGGRDARVIRIEGVVEAADAAAVDAALDAILEAASVAEAVLSLREGRRMVVSRKAFSRTLLRGGRAASYVLELEAADPYEYAVVASNAAWSIAASGATQAVLPEGNTESLPTITLTATGDLVRPSISDGARSITYDGIVGDGAVLILDSQQKRATLDSTDVTPYISGDFPQLDPAGTTLVYTDDAASSHTAAAVVSWLDRWW